MRVVGPVGVVGSLGVVGVLGVRGALEFDGMESAYDIDGVDVKNG
ncbi:MAG: hypothetical protein WCJ31_07365 [Planctomycetia bacterium]